MSIPPNITPERIAASRERLAAFNFRHPPGPVTIDDVTRAMAHTGPNDYFITTFLYWDCNCERDYHRPKDMDVCENCGALAEDSADARLHELKAEGIHLDYYDPATLATMDEHNIGVKYAGAA